MCKIFTYFELSHYYVKQKQKMLAKTFVGSIIIRGSMTPTNIALHEIPVRGVRPVSIFALLSLYIIIIQNQKIIINTHLKLVNTLAETDTLIIIMLWHRFIYGAINTIDNGQN